MDVQRIVSELDAEITRLQKIREALTGLGSSVASPATPEPKRRGRPKGSKNVEQPEGGKRKRQLSPEGRKRIADAMKKRWETRRQEAA